MNLYKIKIVTFVFTKAHQKLLGEKLRVHNSKMVTKGYFITILICSDVLSLIYNSSGFGGC